MVFGFLEFLYPFCAQMSCASSESGGNPTDS